MMFLTPQKKLRPAGGTFLLVDQNLKPKFNSLKSVICIVSDTTVLPQLINFQNKVLGCKRGVLKAFYISKDLYLGEKFVSMLESHVPVSTTILTI